MKKYLLLFITPLLLSAQSYIGKIEPYEEYSVYAQSSGEITMLDKDDETKLVNKTVIKLDDSLEKSQLRIYKNQLKMYAQKLSILQKSYEKYVKIKGKSQFDKDEKLYELIELKISIETLKSNIKELEYTISKKRIHVKNLYLKEFLVDLGDYVSIGSKLATAYDISKSKVIVYVSSDDYKNIKNKKILVDGKAKLAFIEKIDKTVDDTYVSAYKITLIIESKEFGRAVKVEFI